MNEISRIEADQGTQTPLSSAMDLRAYVDRTSKMRESADITKIAPSLVRAQAALENPPRNRSVQVRTQAGTYTFRYATLDKITEMTRRALAENGLCVLQPIVSTEKGPALVTRLLHESGQWMECEILMPPLGNNPQAFGSAVTYLRRYSISSMLNISADEDDDANRAASNHVADLTPRRERTRSGDAPASARARDEERDAAPRSGASADGRASRGAPWGDAGSAGAGEADPTRALVNRARVAEGVEEGHALLEAWLREANALEPQRGGKAWETLERELGGALKRTLGTDPAAAFIGALRATDAQQVAALQQHWEGKWAETLAAMQQEAPSTYALLRRHVAAQIARVRGLVGEAPAFEARLRDESGEAASDAFTDPVAFARAYAEAWQATEASQRQTLARHNVKALAQAAKSAAARAVLDALSPADAADAAQSTPVGAPAPNAAPAGAASADPSPDESATPGKERAAKPSEGAARRGGPRATA